MRVSTVVIILLVIGGGYYYANKKGYIGQAKQNVANSFDAHFEKGQLLYQGMKYPEAMEEFQKAIDLAPQNPQAADAMARIGNCYRDMGEKEKAIATYQQVIKTYPESTVRPQVEKMIEKIR